MKSRGHLTEWQGLGLRDVREVRDDWNKIDPGELV
jgi:hypothetical protein